MAFWTPQQFELVTAGTWVHAPTDADARLAGVSIDSRTIRPGEVFVALPGERFDGHDFLEAAAEAGAAILIVEEDAIVDPGVLPDGSAVLQVTDTHATLRQIGRAYRGWLAAHDVTVIAVTGSNGKTTTRHLIHAACSAGLRGTQSPKSFNNHIGVPLTLLAAGADDDFVVVEIGTNHPGEVAALGELVRPDAAVITSVGEEHMEFFGTLEAVAVEEASIARFVRPGGFVVTPSSPHLTSELMAGQLVDALRWHQVEAPAVSPSEGRSTSRAVVQSITMDGGPSFDLPLLGKHNAMNAALAMTVARQMDVDDESAAAALRDVRPMPMRLEVQVFGGGEGEDDGDGVVTVINDAYNANPDSMREALSVLASFGGDLFAGRRVAILGDMFKLASIC